MPKYGRKRKFGKRKRSVKAAVEKLTSPLCIYKSQNGGLIGPVNDKKVFYTCQPFLLGDYTFLRSLCGLNLKQLTLTADGNATSVVESALNNSNTPMETPIHIQKIVNNLWIKNRGGFAADVTIHYFKVVNDVEDLSTGNDGAYLIMQMLWYLFQRTCNTYGVPTDPWGSNGIFSLWGTNSYDEQKSAGMQNTTLISSVTQQAMQYDWRIKSGDAPTGLREAFFNTNQLVSTKDMFKANHWFKCYGKRKVHIPPGDVFHTSQKIHGIHFTPLDDYASLYKGQSSISAGFSETVAKMSAGSSSLGLMFKKGQGKFMVVEVHGGIPFVSAVAPVAGTDGVGYPGAALEFYVSRFAAFRKGIATQIKQYYLDPPAAPAWTYTGMAAYQEGEDTGNLSAQSVQTLGQ